MTIHNQIIKKIQSFLLSEKGYWFILFTLLLLKSGYYMFRYYPVIDDWFIYLGNATYTDKWNDVLITNGLLKLRPLAGLTDVYVIGVIFGNHMSFVYFILTLMLGASAYLFSKVLSSNCVTAGSFFLLLYAFMPVNTEAMYWISASSRIIPTLFFIALSGYYINSYLNKPSFKVLFYYTFSTLLSVCYYEATLPLVITYPLIILWLKRKNSAKIHIKFAIILIPAVCIALTGIFYALNSDSSDIAARGSIIKGNYLEHFHFVYTNYLVLFTDIYPQIMRHSLQTGILALLSDRAVLYTLLSAALSMIFGFIVCKNSDQVNHPDKNKYFVSLAVGFILLGAGISVNFLLSYVRLSLRVAYISFLGLGIMIQAVYELLFSKMIKLKGALIAIAVFICIIGSVGELNGYKKTSETDLKIANQLMETNNGNRIASHNGIGFLVGAKNTYISEETLYYEHIKSAVESYASLTGCLRYVLGHPRIYNLMTADDGEICNLHNIDAFYDVYYFYGLDDEYNVLELDAVLDENGIIAIYQTNGILYGRLTPVGEMEYLYSPA